MAASPYDEERDVHPIFRANPHLVEPGATFAGAERFLHDSLRHIDLRLVDANGIPLFVEVKWSGFAPLQPSEYLDLLTKEFGGKPFRLMWLVPEDMTVNVPKPIELKTYKRASIIQLIELRRRARAALSEVVKGLSTPIVVQRALMYQEEVTFPNIISACYFDGTLQTQKGNSVKVGLRKQAMGRNLDLLRGVCQSQFADDFPELALLLAHEILTAPLYYGTRERAGVVEPRGLVGQLTKYKHSGYYRPVVHAVMPLYEELDKFLKKELNLIQQLHGAPHRADLLYRVILSMPPELKEMGMIPARRVTDELVKLFNLHPTQPVKQVQHRSTEQVIINTLEVTNYEHDMAKRLVELATLRRILIPIAGVASIWTLVEQYDGARQTFMRTQSQGFKVNKDAALVKPAYRS